MAAVAAGAGRVDVEVTEGPWGKAAAATSVGRVGSNGLTCRASNEDVHVILCSGLTAAASLAGGAESAAAAPLPGGGLFDDLPDIVSGPALPPAGQTPVDCLFAVFDGHGGDAAARLCAHRLPLELEEQLEAAGRDTPEARRLAVEGVFQALDRLLRIKLGPRVCSIQGTTCVFGFAWQEEDMPGKFRLLLANLGDSRAMVLSAAGSAGLKLAGETADHKPDAPGEQARIEAAGGKVGVSEHEHVDFQRPRVDYKLGCSRALGDFMYKADAALLPEEQKVSNKPDVSEFCCQFGDAVVLACDGALDVLSSEQIAAIVAGSLQAMNDPAAAATAVVEAALHDPRQGDNCTCVVFRT